MNAHRFFLELAWPLTDRVVLVAIVVFTLLLTLARAAGLLGLWLGLALLPAVFRYLLQLLEARACGRSTPVASLELFSISANYWSLAPLVIFALLIWGSLWLDAYVSPAASLTFSAALCGIVPASLAVLAMTRSPLQSFAPNAIARMIAVCGWQYVLVPAAVATGYLFTSLLLAIGAPDLFVRASGLYCLFLLFTFTGGLLRARDVRFALSFEGDDNQEPPPEIDDLTRSRQRVLNHAYGFFSRGNRSGAMAHIRGALESESDIDGAYRWYFDELLKWESRDGALSLAQTNLARLLDEERDVEAVKLISRCLLEDPRFRPLPADLDAALNAAARLDREDVSTALQQ